MQLFWQFLQCVAVCCSVLQCVAVCGSVSPLHTKHAAIHTISAVCCSVLQCVAACCRCTLNLQIFIQFLQCVAVCCSVLQCVAACRRRTLNLQIFVQFPWVNRGMFISNMNWLEYQSQRHRSYNYYGVATISNMLKNIGLFCKRALQKRPVFCKETCIFKHPTHRSHPITHTWTYKYWLTHELVTHSWTGDSFPWTPKLATPYGKIDDKFGVNCQISIKLEIWVLSGESDR